MFYNMQAFKTVQDEIQQKETIKLDLMSKTSSNFNKKYRKFDKELNLFASKVYRKLILSHL
jgi:hypothetical protein